MPIYEYRCSACGNQYEKREGFDAPSRQRCPKCRKTANRVIQAAPIVFKGSGFYVTDSRGSSPTSASTSESSSDSGTSSSDSSDTSDPEPAAAG